MRTYPLPSDVNRDFNLIHEHGLISRPYVLRDVRLDLQMAKVTMQRHEPHKSTYRIRVVFTRHVLQGVAGRAHRRRRHGVSYRRCQQLHADCRSPDYYIFLALLLYNKSQYILL
eukprot:1462161-Pleurochrysis_carterae.AAC.1